ncbi:hypothetical protein [Streptococcus thoraltensis]|nr:hypothetical protein [Streptococcus thoraltensis]
MLLALGMGTILTLLAFVWGLLKHSSYLSREEERQRRETLTHS